MIPRRRRARAIPLTLLYGQTVVPQRPAKRAREEDEAEVVVDDIDEDEEPLINLVCSNDCGGAARLMHSKNICGLRLDQISVTSEHYKCDIDPSFADPSLQLDYTLLDITIIYGNIALAKLLLDYGARAISPFIRADDAFADFIAELEAHQEARAAAFSRVSFSIS